MTNDDLFHLILIIIFVAFVPFALHHRIRSKTDDGGKERKRFLNDAVVDRAA